MSNLVPGCVNDTLFIPIIAIVTGIAIAMLATWTDHKRKAQLLEQYHKERMLALEKGQPLPEVERGLALDADAPPTAEHAYRNGLMLLLIGIVLFFALEALLSLKFALFGLIPAAIGVANLAYGRMLTKKASSESER